MILLVQIINHLLDEGLDESEIRLVFDDVTEYGAYDTLASRLGVNLTEGQVRRLEAAMPKLELALTVTLAKAA